MRLIRNSIEKNVAAHRLPCAATAWGFYLGVMSPEYLYQLVSGNND